MKISNLIRSNIKTLIPYSSAREEFSSNAKIFLDANENPFENGVNRYPDPHQSAVKAKLAQIKNIDADKILLGNGSDEILDLIFRTFCEPKIDNVITHNPSYGMYKVLATINDIEFRTVNLKEDFTLDTAKIMEASDVRTKLFIICSPNNPSGNMLDNKEIKKILDLETGLVVIDEAYIDFAKSVSWITELDNYKNLIVCQTLSKAWGLAGLRVGMCFASKEIIKVLSTIKPPYNINELSQKAVLKALKEEPLFNAQVSAILKEKAKLEFELATHKCIKRIYPSDANFILVKVDDVKKMYHFLLEKGIVIRDRSKEYLCENALRITIGTPVENKYLLQCLNEYES